MCYLLANFCMSLYFLLLKAYKEEKSSDSLSWIEQYKDILGRPPTEWSHEQKQEMGQLEEGIGKDKAQGVLEETIHFLIFFMMIRCGPYILEGEVKKLLDRFYKVASTEWMPISKQRDRHIKYARVRNPLEKFSIDLAIILDQKYIYRDENGYPSI